MQTLERREFLKKVAAAGVLATVAPSVIMEQLVPKSTPALTLAALTEMYDRLTIGRDEPDLIHLQQW